MLRGLGTQGIHGQIWWVAGYGVHAPQRRRSSPERSPERKGQVGRQPKHKARVAHGVDLRDRDHGSTEGDQKNAGAEACFPSEQLWTVG